VHANLLKAKIALALDPAWLKVHSVTGAEFGASDLPVFDPDKSAENCPHDTDDVALHLLYQLTERRQFIPGPDPIVAALMFDLANAVALTETVETAIPIYTAAKELGYHDPSLVDRRVSAMQSLSRSNPLSGKRHDDVINAKRKWFAGSILAILVTVLALDFIRRKRQSPVRGRH
jgi:hypothetical protein